MDYRIQHKSSFSIMGVSKTFNANTSYKEIPQFWAEHFANKEQAKKICGMFGICWNCDGKTFDYYIADRYSPSKEKPEGYITKMIPESDWAVFPCTLATLQDVNTKVWSNWLTSNTNYRLNGDFNIEMYEKYPEENLNAYVELWVPVIEKQNKFRL